MLALPLSRNGAAVPECRLVDPDRVSGDPGRPRTGGNGWRPCRCRPCTRHRSCGPSLPPAPGFRRSGSQRRALPSARPRTPVVLACSCEWSWRHLSDKHRLGSAPRFALQGLFAEPALRINPVAAAAVELVAGTFENSTMTDNPAGSSGGGPTEYSRAILRSPSPTARYCPSVSAHRAATATRRLWTAYAKSPAGSGNQYENSR